MSLLRCPIRVIARQSAQRPAHHRRVIDPVRGKIFREHAPKAGIVLIENHVARGMQRLCEVQRMVADARPRLDDHAISKPDSSKDHELALQVFAVSRKTRSDAILVGKILEKAEPRLRDPAETRNGVFNASWL